MMENRINALLRKKDNILSIYFTAGYPQVDDTVKVMEALQAYGADMIEIGVPFSDPIADGPIIQHSNTVALAQGMSVKRLFRQLENIRSSVHIPFIMMSSLNPMIQYGFERFCSDCRQIGVDGLIIPDLPVEEYIHSYKANVEAHGLRNIILVAPASTDKRIRMVDKHTDAFIYMVSSPSTTGENKNFDIDFEHFAQRLVGMRLKNPIITGFGIKDKSSFEHVCQFAKGGIIGSAFIRALGEEGEVTHKVQQFMQSLA